MLKNLQAKALSQISSYKLKKKKFNNSPLLKTEVRGKKSSTGRNNSGKITVRHKGGGVKRLYRIINFKRIKASVEIVCGIEYDPNRNAFIAVLYDFSQKSFSYIIAPQGLKTGDIVNCGQEALVSLGSSLPLSNIPLGTNVYNINEHYLSSATIARSAGTFAIVKEKSDKGILVYLKSGKKKMLPSNCFASIGEVSNESSFLQYGRKAGRSRWLNKRPTVRGVAMNPVDHPHGGGEGKKSGIAKTPWGRPSKKTKNKYKKL